MKRELALSASCAGCGEPAKPTATFLYTRGRKAEEYVPLCEGCWGDGANDEAWDDKIQKRIADRRAGRKPKRRTFSILVTVKHTWSLRDVEAVDEGAAVAKVKAMELDELERHGHEIDCDVDVDSIDEEPRKPATKAKKGRRE